MKSVIKAIRLIAMVALGVVGIFFYPLLFIMVIAMTFAEIGEGVLEVIRRR